MAPTALQILEITEDSFKIHKANFNSVLKKVGPRPFVLYSINGATRTGKSYALNFFVRYLEAKGQNVADWLNFDPSGKFVWKSGKERTTVGINLWSEPYIVKDGGREIAILLMDTQGLFDEQTTARQNAIIFSLSALCSSVSIFNLMKNIDENVLQQLQFFSGYAHLVSVPDSAENEMDDVEAFQKLIFLIRDFDFPDFEYGYHDMHTTVPHSANNFCRDTFKKAQNSIAKENLFVREKILEAYKDVAVCLMPHPGKSFVRNSSSATDADFDENIKSFIELVNSPSHRLTKRIGGHEVTGTEFQKYIEAWAKLCDKADQHFPKVQTILESTAIIQNTLALSTANSLYEKQMKTFMETHPNGVEARLFRAEHEKARAEALGLFKSMKKLGNETTHEKYTEILVGNIEKWFESHERINGIEQEKEAMEKEYAKQQEEVQKMQQAMEKMAGDNAERQRELENHIKESEQKLKSVAQDNLKAQQELKERIAKAKAEAEANSKRNEIAQREMRDKMLQSEKELKDVKNNNEAAQKELKEAIKSSQENANQMAKANEVATRELIAQIEASQRQLDNVVKENEKRESALKLRMEADAEKAKKFAEEAKEKGKRQKADMDKMNSKIAEVERKRQDAESKLIAEADSNRNVGGLFSVLGQVLDTVLTPGGAVTKLFRK